MEKRSFTKNVLLGNEADEIHIKSLENQCY